MSTPLEPPVTDQPDPTPGTTPGSPVSCALCGATAAGPPLTWMFEMDKRRGWLAYCDSCARQNVRSVEAKLDHVWW